MLLDLYRSRFGQAVKQHGDSWNGPCPLCGGEPGKSDRFLVWPERSEHLGDVCAKNGINGIWWCRQCGASGDTIAYLTRIDGLSFRDALADLGIQGAKKPWRRRQASVVAATQEASRWEPKPQPEPEAEWRSHAEKLVAEAERKIWDCPLALRWLAARGIGEAAIRKYRLGYLDEESQKYHGRSGPAKPSGWRPKPAGMARFTTGFLFPGALPSPPWTKTAPC